MCKIYAGQLLQVNLLFLFLNIFCVFVIQSLTNNSFYAQTAAVYTKQLIVLILLWGFYLYMRRLDIRQQRLLVRVYLLVIAISTVYTFYVALNGDDNVIRSTAYGQYDPQFPLAYGGFDFIYGLVVIYSILLIVLWDGWKKIRWLTKVVVLLFLLLIAATVIISGYSTAFALMLAFTFLCAPKKTGTKVMWIIMLVIFLFGVPQILTGFIESIPFMPEITSSRINELILSVSGQGSSDYLSAEGQRLDRVLWSLRAFAANPLLGLFGENGTEALGYHTEWIEQLARYGMFTAMFNLGFWCTTFKQMELNSMRSSITHKCVVSAFVVYFILGFLNPISMLVTTAPLFVLGPFAENALLIVD